MGDRWREVEELFQAAVELPRSERTAFLARRCGADLQLRRDVESLADHLDGAERFVAERAAQERCGSTPPEEPCSGQRVGPYRLERELGSGGMAVVHLATRDDGQFRRRVAVKLVRRELDPGWAVDRFRHERQLLAGLSHPNIAQLLDGGATGDGLPYLVMEYVEGQPITRYCQEKRLSVPDRLRLFLGVCEAVACAHRNLVVHRDLKPANILVTPGGQPKLLDFGIAKLLDPLCRQGERPTEVTEFLLTPDYASPEQLRGEPVTTATDVYSLGAVLSEMLPVRGGTVRPGDLDTIVAMAMRQEPDRRYSSVERFAEDVRRHLACLPVRARPDTLGYRAGKFLRRHVVGVTAAALLAVSLAGGVAATAWQARRVALQVARAERQFLQFRKLGNAFLFEFHDRIQGLNSLSEARQVVIDTGVEYVDGLAREAGDDPILSRELARAYEKLGDLQGFRHAAGLGQPGAALASYSKALSLLEPLARAGQADREALVLLSRCHCSAGEMEARLSGQAATALASYERCLAAAVRAGEGRPTGRRVAQLLTRAHHLLGDARLANGDRDGAMRSYSTLLPFLERDRRAFGPEGDGWLAETKRRTGRWQATGGDQQAARRSLLEALALARQVSAGGDPTARRLLLQVCLDWVELEPVLPGPPEATAARALGLARELSAAYPQNVLLREDLERAVRLSADFP